MPCLNLYTNVSLEGVDTSTLLADATRIVADVIQKPLNYVMVVLKGSVPICFGGTEQPAAYGELLSVGGIDTLTNRKVTAAVATILSKRLSIPKSRFFLLFHDSKLASGWTSISELDNSFNLQSSVTINETLGSSACEKANGFPTSNVPQLHQMEV